MDEAIKTVLYGIGGFLILKAITSNSNLPQSQSFETLSNLYKQAEKKLADLRMQQSDYSVQYQIMAAENQLNALQRLLTASAKSLSNISPDTVKVLKPDPRIMQASLLPQTNFVDYSKYPTSTISAAQATGGPAASRRVSYSSSAV